MAYCLRFFNFKKFVINSKTTFIFRTLLFSISSDVRLYNPVIYTTSSIITGTGFFSKPKNYTDVYIKDFTYSIFAPFASSFWFCSWHVILSTLEKSLFVKLYSRMKVVLPLQVTSLWHVLYGFDTLLTKLISFKKFSLKVRHSVFIALALSKLKLGFVDLVFNKMYIEFLYALRLRN